MSYSGCAANKLISDFASISDAANTAETSRLKIIMFFLCIYVGQVSDM